MQKKKNFFESTEEDIAKRVRLFKYKIVVGISVAILGGFWMQYKAMASANKQKRNLEIRTKLRKDALSKFVNNPTLLDTYYFEAEKIATGKTAAISATINSINKPEILFSFNADGNYLGIQHLTFNQLNAISEKDSTNIAIGNIQYLLYGIRSYNRNDGLNFRSFSVGKKNVAFMKKGEDATLLNIENIIGTSKTISKLPYELSDGKINFQITREENRAEFRIIGKTKKSDKWSRRIVVDGWKAYVFPE